MSLITHFSKNNLAFKSSLFFGAAAILIAASGVCPAQAAPVPYTPLAKVATATAAATGGQSNGIQVTQGPPAKVQVLNLPKGRSAVIDLPVDASDVFVSNPAIADAVLRTPRRIFVLGVDAGQSDAIFFDQMGRQILNLSIRVDAPTDQLSDAVAHLFPRSRVEIQSLNGKVVLSGMAQNNAEADQVYRLAQGFVSKPEDVVNLMSIAGKDQVTLKVRIVEVNRSTIKQLGFAATLTQSGSNGIVYALRNSISFGVNNKSYSDGGLGMVNNRGNTELASNLSAFERVGLVRTLAEPNLTSVSGEAAKFLVGGEFPVPVAQDNQGRVTVDFKPFGVGLGFTPVVLSSGRISLKISTEVSELTNVGALKLNESLTLPGLSVRRAEDTVEMQSGSSMMIAGLLQQKYKQSIDGLPGLTTLPILGALFRSRDFINDETELVIIVTPYIVSPTDPADMQTPADNLQLPNDLQSVFMGRLNTVVKQRHGETASDSDAPPAYSAPVGYVIE